MSDKKCPQCGTMFEPKGDNKGLPQIYCSVSCRNKAYRYRVIEKYKQNNVNEVQQFKQETDIRPAYPLHNVQREIHPVADMGGSLFDRYLAALEAAKVHQIEAMNWKHKFENAEQILMTRVGELERRLENEEVDDQNDETDGGMMGYITRCVEASPELGNGIGKLLQLPGVLNLVEKLANNGKARS